MVGFVLCLILLRVPIAGFCLIYTWAIWSFHWRCLSNNAPRYLTDCDGLNLFPASVSLWMWSMPAVFLWKVINLVLEILRLSLVALSHCKRLFDLCSNYLIIYQGIYVVCKVICFRMFYTSVKIIDIENKEQWP